MAFLAYVLYRWSLISIHQYTERKRIDTQRTRIAISTERNVTQCYTTLCIAMQHIATQRYNTDSQLITTHCNATHPNV